MTPNPIRKVLSTLRTNRVRFLLMGGQACVLYGAAEFSRDLDLVLLPNPANLAQLEADTARTTAPRCKKGDVTQMRDPLRPLLALLLVAAEAMNQ